MSRFCKHSTAKPSGMPHSPATCGARESFISARNIPLHRGVFLFIKTGRGPPLPHHKVTGMYNKIPKFRQFHPAYIQSPKSRCQFSGYLASVSKKPTTITWKMKGVFKRCFGWNKFCVRYCNQYCRNNKHTGFDGLV